jgi:hypothetical protein
MSSSGEHASTLEILRTLPAIFHRRFDARCICVNGSVGSLEGGHIAAVEIVESYVVVFVAFGLQNLLKLT